MAAVNDVLVVGAGMAGVSLGILLAEAGVDVRIVDTKDGVHALGSGITLQGNALRVLRVLGVWDQVAAHGYAFDGLGLRAPDPHGSLVAELTELRTGGPDLPATLGIYRPDLARIVVDRAVEAGVRFDYGLGIESLDSGPDAVSVAFTDGTAGRYDLVVGADGIRSQVRSLIGITTEPRRTGMGIWRAFTTRPESVTRTDLYYGGPSYIAGYCPTGQDSLYAYVVEDYDPARLELSPQDGLDVMRELSTAYHGPWDDIRERLTDPSRVNYTKFETHVVPDAWHRGRVVLAGDAAHSCPPTIAQGAAMALEDAAVLAEILTAADDFDDALLRAYADRRLPRAGAVVEGSVQLGDWLLAHERGDVPGLMGRISGMLAQKP
ncbi:FAD-dependent monooxygenase [Agilicoccus flavus]|uniref:FAD-dependent monooxygenase n=1 Tax=Agilicoccus flavus TaxID=2775968 RepID=UPI001CF715F8|nr:FAD-dependent monooxygenase [Agilicoccus flavus]